MSALSVVGEKRIENMFMWDCEDFDKEGRNKCGAYILKFWIQSSWVYVIVDDILPYTLD